MEWFSVTPLFIQSIPAPETFSSLTLWDNIFTKFSDESQSNRFYVLKNVQEKERGWKKKIKDSPVLVDWRMHVKPEESGMTPSPTANRSFLHGDRPPCLNSDKIIYATLDSLALKRATLPLKLLPIDNNIVDNPANIDNKEKIIPRKLSSRKPSFKVSNLHICTFIQSFYWEE